MQLTKPVKTSLRPMVDAALLPSERARELFESAMRDTRGALDRMSYGRRYLKVAAADDGGMFSMTVGGALDDADRLGKSAGKKFERLARIADNPELKGQLRHAAQRLSGIESTFHWAHLMDKAQVSKNTGKIVDQLRKTLKGALNADIDNSFLVFGTGVDGVLTAARTAEHMQRYVPQEDRAEMEAIVIGLYIRAAKLSAYDNEFDAATAHLRTATSFVAKYGRKEMSAGISEAREMIRAAEGTRFELLVDAKS